MTSTSAIAIDIRAKLIGGLVLILAIVLAPVLSFVKVTALVALFALVFIIFDISLVRGFGKALIVIPFAGAVALFSPLAMVNTWSLEAARIAYQVGWPTITDILAKSYLSALVVTAVIDSASIPVVLAGMSALRLPRIFLTLFTFLYRFTDLFAEQIKTMRDAIASRAPGLKGLALIRLYGRLGGNLFVRAYERGEQIHDAMISRGYTGSLPSHQQLCWRGTDTLALGLCALIALTLQLIA